MEALEEGWVTSSEVYISSFMLLGCSFSFFGGGKGGVFGLGFGVLGMLFSV